MKKTCPRMSKKSKYNIVVSGAAITKICCHDIERLSKEIGIAIAESGHTLITGATTGVPYFAALGCKEAGGFNVGFSPAESELAHIKTYCLPVDTFDVMVYTGADYAGRDVTMTKAADAVIIVCGRMGTLHEFTTAVETKKPIGVLERTGGTADEIRNLMKRIFSREEEKVIFETDPKILVAKMIKTIEQNKKQNIQQLKKRKARQKLTQ
ncbi:MAG: hypothetical protein WC427_01135 [Candidatus Paceibacterota bacterium]